MPRAAGRGSKPPEGEPLVFQPRCLSALAGTGLRLGENTRPRQPPVESIRMGPRRQSFPSKGRRPPILGFRGSVARSQGSRLQSEYHSSPVPTISPKLDSMSVAPCEHLSLSFSSMVSCLFPVPLPDSVRRSRAAGDVYSWCQAFPLQTPVEHGAISGCGLGNMPSFPLRRLRNRGFNSVFPRW